MSNASSPSLVLTWIDPRPRLAWCGLCLLLLLALAEVAWRGYLPWALGGLLAWGPLAWFARPPPAGLQRLERQADGLIWRPSPQAVSVELSLLPGTLLLPRLVVLPWRPPGGRTVRYLWVWRGDVGDAGFRQLRRWLLCGDMA